LISREIALKEYGSILALLDNLICSRQHKDFVDIMWQRAVKKSGLEGLVVKRKDGKYAQQAVWYKILNPTYTQKAGRQDF
jgi:hypothetical protein